MMHSFFGCLGCENAASLMIRHRLLAVLLASLPLSTLATQTTRAQSESQDAGVTIRLQLRPSAPDRQPADEPASQDPTPPPSADPTNHAESSQSVGFETLKPVEPTVEAMSEGTAVLSSVEPSGDNEAVGGVQLQLLYPRALPAPNLYASLPESGHPPRPRRRIPARLASSPEKAVGDTTTESNIATPPPQLELDLRPPAEDRPRESRTIDKDEHTASAVPEHPQLETPQQRNQENFDKPGQLPSDDPAANRSREGRSGTLEKQLGFAAPESLPPSSRNALPMHLKASEPLDEPETAAPKIAEHRLDATEQDAPASIPARLTSEPLRLSTSRRNANDSRDSDLGLELSTKGDSRPGLSPNSPSSKMDLSNQLSLEPSIRKDPDASNEYPGSPTSESTPQHQMLPDDLPLEQEEHPYDAPAARSTTQQLALPKSAVQALSQRELKIKSDIQRCLQYFLAHPENTTRRGPWALMHVALPFGVEAEVIAGNRRVNAIGWMSYNGVCAKQRMFQPTRQGFRTNVGAGVQGHEGQFLAILAQSSVSSDYPLVVGNRRYTVGDLVQYEMATCREKSELTFKLIGLSHYLNQNQTWRDNRGQVWNLEKMVAEELAQPIVGAACGGTHRLMGLSYSLLRRQASGLPTTGHWKRSEVYLSEYVNYAMSLQNPDGSFSTDWFEARAMDPDVERKVQTTGHILEWLVFTLPAEQLRSPRIQLSIEFLLNTVGRDPARDWPIGPRGHALRTLAVYSQRVFGAEPGKLQEYVSGNSTPRFR